MMMSNADSDAQADTDAGVAGCVGGAKQKNSSVRLAGNTVRSASHAATLWPTGPSKNPSGPGG